MICVEEILAQRVLVDEDSFNAAFSGFCSYLSVKDDNKTPQECEESYQHLLQQLAVFEHDVQLRASAFHTANVHELAQYDTQQGQASAQLDQVRTRNAKLEEELSQEQVNVAHKKEYEALAKVINTLEKRGETQARLEELRSVLDELAATRVDLAQQKDQRRREFGLFFHALSQLEDRQDEDGGGVVQPVRDEDEDVAMQDAT